jgi:type III restriction enzyme
MSKQMDFIASQSSPIEPEQFQLELIANLSTALLCSAPAPCLLRAPTGAGKTFVITKVLDIVSSKSATVWFWFVPFINLVQQTEDSIAGNAVTLVPISLAHGRNQIPENGYVFIATAQSVSSAKSRKTGYTDGTGDFSRSLDSLKHLALAKGLQIGLVVDEAHIALDSQTEFGKFAQWLSPHRLLMATATPKDDRLNDFLVSAGYSGFESFQVSRDEVVTARLNKRYIEAVVYSLRESVQTVTDLEQTVLRQAWKRNRALRKKLSILEIPIVPLLLVQVGNGANTVAQARQQLIDLCGIPLSAIGEHSSDEPNPVLMAAIANDTSKEVLIFKQSAGTGFDAPRAFVLASTKPVNDPDFAAQFIGRVMRVHRAIRSKYPRPLLIESDLDTAYVYLANSEAQQGFEQAVASTAGLKSQLEGQSEKLVARKMASGALVYTNREEKVRPLFYDTQLPTGVALPKASTIPSSMLPGFMAHLPGFDVADDNGLIEEAGLDQVVGIMNENESLSAGKPKPSKNKELNQWVTVADWINELPKLGLRAYPRRTIGLNPPTILQSESRPEMENMSAASKRAAIRLNLTSAVEANAVATALGRIKEREIHTELTTHTFSEQDVFVVVSRGMLARDAWRALATLPQVEEEDSHLIIDILAKRLRAAVANELSRPEDDAPDENTITQYSRDAAYAVIRREVEALGELLHEEIASQSVAINAKPLPDAMIFPHEIGLETSVKNLYGVFQPSKDDVARVSAVLTIDVRSQLTETTLTLEGKDFLVAPFDGAHALGKEERAFARALDRASFVHWWHRNPDRKGYSVRVVRGEHKNYFYPDFIVCLEHFPGDGPLMRLVETKESVKDAARKARRASPFYGKVLFMTKDHSKWKIITEEGTLGDVIDLDDLAAMQTWLRNTIPSQTHLS